MNKNAVIYARVSSESDRQSTSRQVDDLTAYAYRNDFSAYRKAVNERPSCQMIPHYRRDSAPEQGPPDSRLRVSAANEVFRI